MPSELTDYQLIVGVAEGRQDCLGELYERYAATMMAVGLKMLHSRDAAEDVIHEVFLEVWEKASTYDKERSALRTWLLVKMRSRTLDRLRSQQRRPRKIVDELVGEEEPRQAPEGARGADRKRVRAVVKGLPDRLRPVVTLFYFGGFTCSEIAEELCIPLGTVKSRLAAGRREVRVRTTVESGGAS